MIIICICIGFPQIYGCDHSRCDSKPESTIIVYATQLWVRPKFAFRTNMLFISLQSTSFMLRSCGLDPNSRFAQICFSSALNQHHLCFAVVGQTQIRALHKCAFRAFLQFQFQQQSYLYATDLWRIFISIFRWCRCWILNLFSVHDGILFEQSCKG